MKREIETVLPQLKDIQEQQRGRQERRDQHAQHTCLPSRT